MEFHVSRQVRDRYNFDQSLFSLSGNIIFANFHAVRLFAQKMNQRRDLVNFPERAVQAGQINAMGMIDEIMHHVIQLYHQQKNPQIMQAALVDLRETIGSKELERTLRQFVTEFPPLAVYRGEQDADDYLDDQTEGIPNRSVVLEEMIMLWIANQNPAFSPFLELFDDKRLTNETEYPQIMRRLHGFFETQPPFGPEQQNLLDMLRSPAIAVPHSLSGQLDFIRERWSELLGRYLYRLLSSLDLIREEEKMSFMGPGPVPIPIYDLSSAELEPENFSADREWMVRLVLIARNAYVWLDQLSKTYQRSIIRLDQVPEEELETLARWGITGLWLIGLWERSQASARIKQLMGNPEALASAYSLSSYSIAADLGGEEAYKNLRDRAARYGIRLASDMVPNHMGIDSPWVIEHPDWFLSLDYSPYPSYTFDGPDLSPDSRVGIFLEDHYYSRTDASVVFKRVDKNTGDTRFIYHGNDGTSMPWNDTAQLNYLNPEVREAVIQTILDVARKFPIIRFDAAMTLAKRHYHRLWFPEPGSGGDIPTRSDHGMTKEEFDRALPVEFWREVVDRAAVEAPDTLLLAEAFWLMEGYFVRTLGMHRVYNSAFMNLLRNEDNAKYRMVMKNTLEFDPEILKRFVNFMNNPDERTAVDQFGKGDKYFGICMMMSTLPGLPMFGHGQVEGFSEKYGMEFRRAHWDETSDPYLVERHEREIFPLLHRRAEFANVDNFLLYDFYNTSGSVDENVYAYSNGLGDQSVNLVVFHNKFGSTSGWIRTSVGFMDKSTSDRQIVQKTLGEGLRIQADANDYVLFRDSITGLEYIRPALELIQQGLYLELNAYKYHVFLDFRVVHDDEWQSYRHLHDYLNGLGVPNIGEALRELLLQPVLNPFREIANPGYFNYLFESRLSEDSTGLPPNLLNEAGEKMSNLLKGIQYLTGYNEQTEIITSEVRQRLETILSIEILEQRFPVPGSRAYPSALKYIQSGLAEKPGRWYTLFAWVFIHNLGKTAGVVDHENQGLTWIEEWQLGRVVVEALRALGMDEGEAWRAMDVIRLLTGQQSWYTRSGNQALDVILEEWLSDSTVRRFLGINRFKDILWFNQESLEEFVWWMTLVNMLEVSAAPRKAAQTPAASAGSTRFVEQVLGSYEIAQQILRAEKNSGFQVNKLIKAVKGL
jgi:glycosidase